MIGPTAGESGGVALLRRILRRRDWRHPGYVSAIRKAALGVGENLVTERDEEGSR